MDNVASSVSERMHSNFDQQLPFPMDYNQTTPAQLKSNIVIIPKDRVTLNDQLGRDDYQ